MLEVKTTTHGYGLMREYSLMLGRRSLLGLSMIYALAGRIDIPTLVLIYTMTETSFSSLWGIVQFMYQFDHEGPKVLKVQEIMNVSPGIVEPDLPTEIPEGPLELLFCGVNFVYPSVTLRPETEIEYVDPRVIALRAKLGMPPLTAAQAERNNHLEDVTLRIPAGQMTALVGHTGSGKTTIANLALKLQVPNSGSILVNGQDITAVHGAALRERMAVVLQDIAIFPGTLAENLCLGKAAYSEEEMIEALKAAQMWDLIHDDWPHLLYTEFGERGMNLSGGQRQRVGIARAILNQHADMAIFDEATAALDSQTEQGIQIAIRQLSTRMTKVVIAHRLATVRDADHIVVLDHGRVTEQGSWDELMAIPSGQFAAFVAAQSLS
jgi:ATP-binding cassette subfamily B protein